MPSLAYQLTPDRPDCSRRAPRTNMFVIADLASTTASGKVKIRNMSASGAMIEGPALPPSSAHCRIRRGGLELEGEVVWVAGNRAGIRFDGTAHVADWLPNGGRTQSDVDRAVAEAKNGYATHRTPPARAADFPSGRCRSGRRSCRPARKAGRCTFWRCRGRDAPHEQAASARSRRADPSQACRPTLISRSERPRASPTLGPARLHCHDRSRKPSNAKWLTIGRKTWPGR